MKLEARNTPRVLQMPDSVARLFTLFILFSALLMAGLFRAPGAMAQEGERRNSEKTRQDIQAIKALAKTNPSDADFSAAVADMVKDDKDDAAALMAEGVKDEPSYACDIIKASFKAMFPQGAIMDPKLIATVAVEIVRLVQATNPDIVKQVVDCSASVDKDAGPLILAGLAGLFNGPNGVNRPPWVPPGPPPGNGHNPPGPPPPVTGFRNM